MNVADIFQQQRRLWVRLHEKGGKFHEMPCHLTLEGYLAESSATQRSDDAGCAATCWSLCISSSAQGSDEAAGGHCADCWCSCVAAPCGRTAANEGTDPRNSCVGGTPTNASYSVLLARFARSWVDRRPEHSHRDPMGRYNVDLLFRAASELVEMKVDVIFASSSTFVEAAKQATKTIPIVFSNHADPVGLGHVESLAHPGGNIAGISMLLTELAAATRIGVLWNPATPSHRSALKSIEAAGEKLRVHVQMVPVLTADEFEAAMSTLKQSSTEAFLDVASPLTFMQRARLAESALKFSLPGMFGYRQSVEVGGLMSYAAGNTQLYRHAAVYVDKILKREKPTELPVEQAATLELVINLKTAKALGLTIPPALLARADEVIE